MSGVRKDWETVKAEAADWAVRTQGSLTKSERAAFDAWCQADQRHVHAYKAAAATVRDLAMLSHLPEAQDLLGAPSWRERAVESLRALAPLHWLVARPHRRLAGALAVAVVAFFAFVLPMGPTVYESQVAEMRAVTLPDGSIVTLGASSRLEADFTRRGRSVTLTHGDAFFAVTKDAARPFIVNAGDTMIRVVGTKFNVARGAEEVRVAVVEGVVELAESDSDAKTDKQTVVAGQQVIAVRGGAGLEFRVSSLTKPTPVSSTRLDYVGANLRDIVAEANRYYAPGIELASEELGDLKVTTSFRATQVEQMIDSLPGILPLSVSREASGRIVLRAR